MAARGQPETDDLMGYFINPVAMRVKYVVWHIQSMLKQRFVADGADIGCGDKAYIWYYRFDKDEGFRQLIGHVRQKVVAGLAHKDCPFSNVVEALMQVHARDPRHVFL